VEGLRRKREGSHVTTPKNRGKHLAPQEKRWSKVPYGRLPATLCPKRSTEKPGESQRSAGCPGRGRVGLGEKANVSGYVDPEGAAGENLKGRGQEYKKKNTPGLRGGEKEGL